MVKAAKHSMYSADEARWMAKQRIKHNARPKRMSKRDLEELAIEDSLFNCLEEDYSEYED
jgi:hypothetical protein